MSRDLYELCPLCDGAGRIEPRRVKLARPVGADGMVECPGCSGKMYVPIGLTDTQVEYMHGRLLAIGRLDADRLYRPCRCRIETQVDRKCPDCGGLGLIAEQTAAQQKGSEPESDPEPG